MMSSFGEGRPILANARSRPPLAASGAMRPARGAMRARRAHEDAALAHAALTAAGDVGTWEWNASTGRLRLDRIACRMLGLPDAQRTLVASTLLARLRLDERCGLLRAARRAADARDGAAFIAEFRTGAATAPAAWVRVRGGWTFDGADRPERLCGTLVDCSAQKAAGEERAMLLREADHRARNALAVTLAVLRLTEGADVAAFRAAARERLAAMARVQTFADAMRHGTPDLEGMLRTQLSPFVSEGQVLELSGPRFALPLPLARLLPLVLHELSVNALKYGALSRPAGRIEVTWRVVRPGRADAALSLRWAEHGGPRPAADPARRGAGSRLIETVVAGRLGGTHAMRFGRAGLACEIRLPLR